MTPAFWAKLPDWFGPMIPAFKTAIAGVVGAALGAAVDVMLVMLDTGGDPLTKEGRAHIAHVALIAGLTTIAGYLRPTPLGRKEWSEDERAAHKAKLAAQNRLP